MIIRSQDKKRITDKVSLDIVTTKLISKALNTFGETIGTETKIYSSEDWVLGIYSTEEKAIKVLDMIQSAYERYKMFTITYQDGMMQKLEKCHGLDGARELISSVFQMPSDEEVEV